jgi:N-acetylmuramoyl-L-alanine amidase
MNPRKIDWIIIHCAATPPSRDIGVVEIRRWHTSPPNNWSDVGYHHVIRRDGVSERGRSENVAGAHARGVNHNSIGICLVGGVDSNMKPEDNFTPHQWATLKSLVTELRDRYPGAKVIGHRDVPGVAKACPSFDVATWLRKEFGGEIR